MVLSGYPAIRDNVSKKHILAYRGYRFPPDVIAEPHAQTDAAYNTGV
jgi:hypothetical protein